MSVNLDNIHFYHQPPPPKPSLPTSRRMPYQTPSAQHCFSHPLPPKPPVDAAATLSTSDRGPTQQPQTSTREGDISYITKVRNEFDVELERLSMAEITAHTRMMHQPNLERPCDYVAPDGAVRDVTQNQNTLHVVTREPAQPEASASNNNKTASQSSVQQSISQEWPSREMCQLVGDVCSSDPVSMIAEAEQDLLGPSIATKLRRDSILSPQSCSEINAQISSPAASSHTAYTSRSPSADLSVSLNTSSHSRHESRAKTMKCDEATLQNTRNEIRDYQVQGECLGNEAAIARSVKNNRLLVTTRPSPASNVESGILKELQPSAVSSPNRPPCSTRLSKMPPTCTRSLCPRPNANTDPERLPSVSVVIIVRESDRLITGTTTNHQIRSRNDGRQDDSKSDNAGDRTGIQDFPNKRYCSAKRPRKRRKPGALPRKETESNTALTKHATGECANTFQNLSDSDKPTANEAQEIFGRGVLRIQPHGCRCTYSFTFLPEAAYSELPSPPPRVSPEHSTCSDSRSQSQSSRRATRRRRYKRIPYTPTENQRLTELRGQHCLPWREVAKHFKHRTQASLQVQYSKIHREAVVYIGFVHGIHWTLDIGQMIIWDLLWTNARTDS